MYSIREVLGKHRAEVIFKGVHDYDYMRFSAELKAAVLAVRSIEGHFDLLVDFTEGQILPQENAAQSERNISWCIDHGMRKSANIVPTITQQMQVKRVSGQNTRLSYFKSRSEAEAWLGA